MNQYKDRLYSLEPSTLFEYKCYYKTNLCKYKNDCKHKNTCYFAHSNEELKKPICMNYFNHNSCTDSACSRLHTNVTPFLPDFLVNIILDIIREKRDRNREKIRDQEREDERIRERKRYRSRSPVNEGGRERSSLQRSRSPIKEGREDDRPSKRYQTTYYDNTPKLTEKEEELHKYYQNQVNEIHQSYQSEINKLSAQAVTQMVLLKQMIDAKDNELVILKTNIQAILNQIYQNKATVVQHQQQHQQQQQQQQQQSKNTINNQPFSPAVQQQIKQEEAKANTYTAELLKALKQYSNHNLNTTNGKPNAPSV